MGWGRPAGLAPTQTLTLALSRCCRVFWDAVLRGGGFGWWMREWAAAFFLGTLLAASAVGISRSPSASALPYVFFDEGGYFTRCTVFRAQLLRAVRVLGNGFLGFSRGLGFWVNIRASFASDSGSGVNVVPASASHAQTASGG